MQCNCYSAFALESTSQLVLVVSTTAMDISDAEEEMEFSPEEVVQLIILLRRQRCFRRKPRRFWVHPLNAVRLDVGQYHTIIDDLRDDKEKFFQYFRMSHESFQELLDMLRPHIQKADTNMRRCISTEERLAIILR